MAVAGLQTAFTIITTFWTWTHQAQPNFLLTASLSTMKKPKDRKVNTVMKRAANNNWRRYNAIWFSSLTCLSMSKHIWEWDLRLHQWNYNMIDGYWQAIFLTKWRWGFQSSRMWHCVGSHSSIDTVPYPRRLWHCVGSHSCTDTVPYDPHQHNSKNLKPCKLKLFLQSINNRVLTNIKHKFPSQISSERMISYSRDAQTLGAWLPRQLNFVWQYNIFNTICNSPP